MGLEGLLTLICLIWSSLLRNIHCTIVNGQLFFFRETIGTTPEYREMDQKLKNCELFVVTNLVAC